MGERGRGYRTERRQKYKRMKASPGKCASPLHSYINSSWYKEHSLILLSIPGGRAGLQAVGRPVTLLTS